MLGGNKGSYILKHVEVCMAFCYHQTLNGLMISAQVRTLVTHVIISFDHRLNKQSLHPRFQPVFFKKIPATCWANTSRNSAFS